MSVSVRQAQHESEFIQLAGFTSFYELRMYFGYFNAHELRSRALLSGRGEKSGVKQTKV